MVSLTPLAAPADDGFAAELRRRPTEKVRVRGVAIHAAELIHRVYQLAGSRPLWDARRVDALMDAIDGVERDGLTPEEYRFAAADDLIARRDAGGLSAAERVDLELLLFEGLIRAVYNLAFGKVDPASLDPNINFARPFSGQDPAPRLVDAIRAAEIEALLDLARPEPPAYEATRKALARYRALRAAGGWKPIAPGPTLKPGALGPRVVALRSRLRITGDLKGPAAADPALYDGDLETAVRASQMRLGLEADGAVGRATIAALNVPVERRIDQIRVNLERQRWVAHEARGELIVVDVAGFEVLWLSDLAVVWRSRVQVGKHYTQSPLFKSEINRIVLNPDWTIPPGIIRRTVIPGMRRNPRYIQDKGYVLLTRDGKRVDPSSVDLTSSRGFPYIVRQPPGPNNALGALKFVFPNPHAVFMHDTNHRDLFDRATRTFSAGCIRVERPFELAERLLAGQGDWTRSKIDAAVATGRTQTINLKRRVRIIIAYHTVVVRDETVEFRPDVYERDGKLLKALNGPFRVRSEDEGTSLGIS